MIRTLAFSFLLGFVFASCGQSEEKPVTAEEAKKFARELEISIEKRDPEFMNNALHKKAFLKKAGMGKSANSERFASGVQQSMEMGTTITNSISKKATYKLVKQYEKNGIQHLLFRMYDDSGLNYHDIELMKSGNDVKIVDIFVYTTGELLSETIKGMYDQMEAMKSSKSLNMYSIAQLPEMKTMMTSGRNQEALDIYNKLPRDVQQMRAVQIMHVLIASGLDDWDQYTAAIEQYKTLYPNEPNMHLLLLDGYIIKKQYDEALKGLNEIDKMVNKDPLLDYYRYLVYTLKEDKVNAKTHLERVMKNVPDFEDGMLELIATYVEEGDKKQADEWIEKFRMTSSYDQERLTSYLNIMSYEAAGNKK